jgi:hypothetical protein|tara:strand:- start:889 stop:1197 length:309 start_codon:yes stop_codon:yes gene_type:complete
MRWEKHAEAEYMAQEYVATLNGPANGHGQYIHKETGLESHFYFSKMVRSFGWDVTNNKIDQEFARLRKIRLENMGSKLTPLEVLEETYEESYGQHKTHGGTI